MSAGTTWLDWNESTSYVLYVVRPESALPSKFPGYKGRFFGKYFQRHLASPVIFRVPSTSLSEIVELKPVNRVLHGRACGLLQVFIGHDLKPNQLKLKPTVLNVKGIEHILEIVLA